VTDAALASDRLDCKRSTQSSSRTSSFRVHSAYLAHRIALCRFVRAFGMICPRVRAEGGRLPFSDLTKYRQALAE
jgi:hypothetical protein